MKSNEVHYSERMTLNLNFYKPHKGDNYIIDINRLSLTLVIKYYEL